MSEIRSALEIALARTEDVKSDKEGVRLKELNEKGKKIGSRYLNDHKDPEKLKEEIGKTSKEEKKEILKGVFQVFRANLALPKKEDYSEDLLLLKSGFSVIAGNGNQLDMLFEQLEKFFGNYTQAKKQLVDGIRNQMGPLARQKSQQISEQRGMHIELNPEDLPEYAQALNENMGKLSEQFGEAMKNVKEELESILKF